MELLHKIILKYLNWAPDWSPTRKSPCKIFSYKGLQYLIVVPPGFEPRQAVPKTAVLPLHHETILCFYTKAVQRYGFNLEFATLFEKNLFCDK